MEAKFAVTPQTALVVALSSLEQLKTATKSLWWVKLRRVSALAKACWEAALRQ